MYTKQNARIAYTTTSSTYTSSSTTDVACRQIGVFQQTGRKKKGPRLSYSYCFIQFQEKEYKLHTSSLPVASTSSAASIPPSANRHIAVRFGDNTTSWSKITPLLETCETCGERGATGGEEGNLLPKMSWNACRCGTANSENGNRSLSPIYTIGITLPSQLPQNTAVFATKTSTCRPGILTIHL